MTPDQDFGSGLAAFLLFILPLALTWLLAQRRHRRYDDRPLKYDRRDRPSGKAF